MHRRRLGVEHAGRIAHSLGRRAGVPRFALVGIYPAAGIASTRITAACRRSARRTTARAVHGRGRVTATAMRSIVLPGTLGIAVRICIAARLAAVSRRCTLPGQTALSGASILPGRRTTARRRSAVARRHQTPVRAPGRIPGGTCWPLWSVGHHFGRRRLVFVFFLVVPAIRVFGAPNAGFHVDLLHHAFRDEEFVRVAIGLGGAGPNGFCQRCLDKRPHGPRQIAIDPRLNHQLRQRFRR